MSKFGGYAGPVKRPLSKIATIDAAALQQISNAIPGVTPEQIDDIIEQVNQSIDLNTKVDKVPGKSLVYDTEIAKIHSSGSDSQDLSGKVDKEVGKGLSTNDYTTGEKDKLAGIESGANNYTHPTNHPPSIITQDVSNRFVTDTEKSTWNGKSDLALGETSAMAYRGDRGKTGYDHSQATHAPSNAQANADITKQEIEAKLIGEISSHTHAGGGGGLTQQQIEGLI